ncbi:unnamed protein product [Rotaria sp. Silwood1]|nr:unnamed protein product [Rotaria sp. Silwood1]CAF1683204.1 unnamed protein product [Rotaria sp. Silwood1]
MEDSLIQLNDLPDEILMMILKKLHSCDVLYSLIGVNKRLDTIVQDSFVTAYLTLTVSPYGFLNFTDPILDRFCSKILPKIHHKIGWINVESSSMERFLRSKNYPNLYSLGLCHLASETARDLFTDGSYLIQNFKNQISSLMIHISKRCQESTSIKDINIFIYTQIFTRFKNLKNLNFNPTSASQYDQLIFSPSPPRIFSSTLLQLRVVKFKFNIHSFIPFNNQINLPSNEYIQHTFKNFANKNQIISSIDCFPKANEFHCHIYSYPYIWTDYDNITNNFRGGLFKSVLKLSLVDERPFEREFFLRIAKSFPCVKELHVHNQEPQKNDNQQWSIIEYSYLIQLDLLKTHENYVEQFLNNTKLSLLHNIYLRVDYDTLQRVTDNFTNDTTRMNCSKIKYLILYNQPEFCSPNLKDYFAHAEIW